MKKLIIFCVGALCIFSLFFNCSKIFQEPSVVEKSFYDTKWVLRDIRINPITLVEGTTPYIVFTKNTKNAAGKSPCNTFSGAFVCDYNTGAGEVAFKMPSITTTKVGCGQNDSLETDFYNILRNAEFAVIASSSLYLQTSTHGSLARFEAQ
jgi:heat shock protein HslJ